MRKREEGVSYTPERGRLKTPKKKGGPLYIVGPEALPVRGVVLSSGGFLTGPGEARLVRSQERRESFRRLGKGNQCGSP